MTRQPASSSKMQMRWALSAVMAALVAWAATGTADAQERRLALLVGHERGWHKDPPLRYALKGDLRPLGLAKDRIPSQNP